MNELEKRYLAHHGILGQKWNRRQGPPYPLGASDHSALEKKEDYKKSLGGGRNEKLYDRNEKSNTIDKEASKKKTSHKIQTTKKSYDESYGSGEITNHKISGGSKINKSIDSYAKDEDYDSPYKFDGIGSEALSIYEKKGLDAAADYLDKNLKTKYEFVIGDELNNDKLYGMVDRFLNFSLDIYGDNYIYSTSGTTNYTDEQYFKKTKQKG